jgi:hypothetical protein
MTDCHEVLVIGRPCTIAQLVVDVQRSKTILSGYVPYPQAIIARCRNYTCAVRTEGAPEDPSLVTDKGLEEISTGNVPNLERMIRGCRNYTVPVRTKRAAQHPPFVPA